MRTIVAPRELHDRLGDPKLVVLDCRHSLQDFGLGRRLYDEGHVPGAFFASVEDDLAGPKTGRNGRHPLPDPET
ncbi:MAG: sulfurtransferase, partial [Candidatus Eremiobacteraeota bacterium]|nr:sulfurtransferase [Candidatus Eremiobacteraeota bacterium]